MRRFWGTIIRDFGLFFRWALDELLALCEGYERYVQVGVRQFGRIMPASRGRDGGGKFVKACLQVSKFRMHLVQSFVGKPLFSFRRDPLLRFLCLNAINLLFSPNLFLSPCAEHRRMGRSYTRSLTAFPPVFLQHIGIGAISSLLSTFQSQVDIASLYFILRCSV